VAKKNKTKTKIKTWAQAIPKEGVVVILGHRGEGKSALAWYLAEKAHKRSRTVVSLGTPARSKRHFPDWVKHLRDYNLLQRYRGLMVIVDEAAFQVSARRHQSPDNVAWTRLVAVCRHSHHLLLFIVQSNRSLDVGLVAEADLVCFKKPSLLHIRFSRPELREDVEEAYRALGKQKKTKAWTFVKEYRNGATGLLRNRLADWWSPAASEAFALVSLENGSKDPKQPSVQPSHGKAHTKK